MTCNCIEEMDAKLAENNLRLDCTALTGGVDTALSVVVTLDTEWIDMNLAPKGKKRNPPLGIASFCPFCGKPTKAEAPRTKENTGVTR